MDASLFEGRRRRVLETIGDGGVMVLAAAPELHTGYDGELRYAVDPEFWYLTGHAEPEAVMVLSGVADEPPCTLFVRPRDRGREIWTGVREFRPCWGPPTGSTPGSARAGPSWTSS
jgi:Xaa-Pro aminopeptidase